MCQFYSVKIGAPEPLKWELKVRRAGAGWDEVKPYSRELGGNQSWALVHLDHINNIKGWSPDCENETNTNLFEFSVRVVVKDESNKVYEGGWSEAATAAAYCNQNIEWTTIAVGCVVASVLAVVVVILSCRFFQYWNQTKDFFGRVEKELDAKFVLAPLEHQDDGGSPGPEFEMSQFGGGGGGSKRNGGNNDDDDTDTLLLEETTPDQKPHRQKSASESATSDLTSGGSSQGGRSGTTDRSSECSGRPLQADLASTCSGYVSMCRTDSGGSGSNYTQVSATQPPPRPSSTPSALPESSSLASQYQAYSCASPQFSSLPRAGSAPPPAYLRRPNAASSFGSRLSSSHYPDVLEPTAEEISLGDSVNPGYSLVTGASTATNLPLPPAHIPPQLAAVSQQLAVASLNLPPAAGARPLFNGYLQAGLIDRQAPTAAFGRPPFDETGGTIERPAVPHFISGMQVTIKFKK